MKNISYALSLLSIVASLGCGGRSGDQHSNFPLPPTPSSQVLDVSGGWQFSTISTVSGMPSLTVSGNVAQSGTSLHGAMHVAGSSCFDQAVSIPITGSLTGNNISLSLPTGGQIVTLTGRVATNALDGTYAIQGGCAGGDHGNVTGMQVPSMTGILTGTFTPVVGRPFDIDFSLNQSKGSSDGSFGITGSGGFSGACLKAGSVMSGSFPTGSFILGTSLSLEIQTDSGILTFTGSADVAGHIMGTYSLVGGNCDQTGTASLITDPWGY
jgi:hypothetical protein